MTQYEHYEKDYLFDEIRRFLKEYDIATLLQIVTDAVAEVEGD